ncbi:MAG TPA: hypothetical protein VE868_01520 [Balneolaceae bacterium]|nr:hypothetical protein [Balneolaceae bacterium]
MTTSKKQDRRCAYCGSRAPVIWVHGHGQCAACGINVAECCQGEQCEKEQNEPGLKKG